MTDVTTDTGRGAESGTDHVLSAERQLMLVDRIQVLQNELAEWRVRDQMSHQRINHELDVAKAELASARDENERLRAAMAEMRRSVTWRIGRLVMLPVRVLRWVLRRGASA